MTSLTNSEYEIELTYQDEGPDSDCYITNFLVIWQKLTGSDSLAGTDMDFTDVLKNLKKGATAIDVNIIGVKTVAGNGCDAFPTPPPPPTRTVAPTDAPVTDDPTVAPTELPLFEFNLEMNGQVESFELGNSNLKIQSSQPQISNIGQFIAIKDTQLIVLLPRVNYYRHLFSYI